MKRTQIKLDSETLKQFQDKCKLENRSMTQVLRELITTGRSIEGITYKGVSKLTSYIQLKLPDDGVLGFSNLLETEPKNMGITKSEYIRRYILLYLHGGVTNIAITNKEMRELLKRCPSLKGKSERETIDNIKKRFEEFLKDSKVNLQS